MDSFSGDKCRDRLTISCDYTVAYLQLPVIGEAHEDCVVQARWFKLFNEPSYSIDYTIEAGYQVVEIGACVLLDLAWLVCSKLEVVLRACEELCTMIVTWYLWHIIYRYLGVFSFKLSHKLLCSYVWIFMVLMCACNCFYFRK